MSSSSSTDSGGDITFAFDEVTSSVKPGERMTVLKVSHEDDTSEAAQAFTATKS